MSQKKFDPITIVAELRQWRLDDERNTVIGTIHNSTDASLKDGDTYCLANFANAVNYPETTTTGAYILIRTHLGRYYKLNKSEGI